MNWREVHRHLRHGAKLIYTNEIPGGWCFAVRHASDRLPGRSTLIPIQRIPRWVGVPNPFDPRPVLAALEMSIAADVS